MRMLPGRAHPLGATCDDEGTNFAVYAPEAKRVELCLFAAAGEVTATATHRLTERTAGVWHGYLRGIRPGQLYGYRVDGPWQPEHGLVFNPAKLLLDPYTRAVTGKLVWHPEIFGYVREGEQRFTRDDRDSAAFVPRSLVTAPERFDWEGDRPPATPWSRTVLYECHVKGMTALHPLVPPDERGRYLGLAHPAVLDHLKGLGVTALSLLPVHHTVDEEDLVQRGLCNYWGYNPLAYLAADARFASKDDGSQADELRTMVKRLHRAGLEVIVDVVFNHTCEGNERGPTLSLRGFANAQYYRLRRDDRSRTEDFTGCGNTLDFAHPRVVQLAVDALRCWVREFHVDGFRFDLATVLGRDPVAFNRHARFFTVLQQDPTLAGVKLIAEPWDVGEGGYQVGNFPGPFAEWNDKYRDTVRRFWRGDEGLAPGLASRLSGSSDLYADDGRHACASVNFVTAHDGFTLADWCRYERKRNDANGQGNRDGTDANFSTNLGVEGETSDPLVRTLRDRMQRNLLATLLLSQGVPMLLGGDELGRTQRGNNNAYCLDDETSWVDWRLDETKLALLAFVRHVLRLRATNPVFHRRAFFTGHVNGTSGARDVVWLDPRARELEGDAWHDPTLRALGMWIAGDATDATDENGAPLVGCSVLLLVNAGTTVQEFILPSAGESMAWRVVVDTACLEQRPVHVRTVTLLPRALTVLEASTVAEADA